MRKILLSTVTLAGFWLFPICAFGLMFPEKASFTPEMKKTLEDWTNLLASWSRPTSLIASFICVAVGLSIRRNPDIPSKRMIQMMIFIVTGALAGLFWMAPILVIAAFSMERPTPITQSWIQGACLLLIAASSFMGFVLFWTWHFGLRIDRK